MTAKFGEVAELEEQAENTFRELKEKSEHIVELENKLEKKAKYLHETEERLANTLEKVEELATQVHFNILRHRSRLWRFSCTGICICRGLIVQALKMKCRQKWIFCTRNLSVLYS